MGAQVKTLKVPTLEFKNIPPSRPTMDSPKTFPILILHERVPVEILFNSSGDNPHLIVTSLRRELVNLATGSEEDIS